MKVSIKRLFILGIVFLFNTNGVYAQCNSFLKKADLSALKTFDYCGSVQVAQMAKGDSAFASLVLSKRKRYRVVVKGQDYLGPITLKGKDKNGKEVSLEFKQGADRYWEILSETKGKVELQISVKKGLNPNRIATKGCVVLAVGEIAIDDLVAISPK